MRVLAPIAIALCIIGSAGAANSQTTTLEMAANMPACLSSDDLDKLFRFLAQKDRIAAERWFQAHVIAGTCRMLPAGQKVFLDQYHPLGHDCVRMPGETDCWYTLNSAIK